MKSETALVLSMTKAVEELTAPEAHIAVTWAGMLPYFTDRYTVDILGKTDPYIAHLPMRKGEGAGRFIHFYPGHLKYDYSHSIGEQKPDLIVQLWQNPDEARPFLKDYVQVEIPGSSLFIRKDSQAIWWEKLKRPNPNNSKKNDF
jgi:hypothetical protein